MHNFETIENRKRADKMWETGNMPQIVLRLQKTVRELIRWGIQEILIHEKKNRY